MSEVPYIQQAVEAAANALMDAEATTQTNAEYYQRSGERTAYRNGYRVRRWRTEIGTLLLHIPKLRQGTYYPAFLDQDDAAARLAELAWDALMGTPDAAQVRLLLADPDDAETAARVLDVLVTCAEDHLTRQLRHPYRRLTVTWEDDGTRLFYGEHANGSRHLLDARPDGEGTHYWRTIADALRERGLHGVREIDGDGLTPDLQRVLWRAFPATARTNRVTLALGTPLPAPTFRDDTPRLLLETTANGMLDVQIQAGHLRAVRRMLARQGDAVGIALSDVA